MYIINFSQNLPISIEKAWDFFSSPANLKKITPPHMGFEITTPPYAGKMYPGQIISYVIKPFLGISLEWITEITHVEENVYFIDEQRFGPYLFWHHEHRFKAIGEQAVMMNDTIYYKVPYGPFGKLLHALKIKKDIQNIFSHRSEVLNELFGPYQEK